MAIRINKFGLPPLTDLCDIFGGSACPPSSGGGTGDAVPYPHNYYTQHVPIYSGSDGTPNVTPCPQGTILANGVCVATTVNSNGQTITPIATSNLLQSIEQFAKDNPALTTGIISVMIVLLLKKK